jgi:hypothetical protein
VILPRMSRAAKTAIAGLVLVAALLFVTVAGAIAAQGSGAFDYGSPAFCDTSESASDFGLSALPPVHELLEESAGRELGHPDVNIYGGRPRVMSKPEEFGYGFSEDDYAGPVPVDWTVTAQLWAVDSDGSAIEEVGHTGRFLKAIDAVHQAYIGLTPPDRRGFYRFDIRFTSHGREIRSYSSYLALVKPEWRARLKLNRTIAHPGERILSRVESLGSETVGYGEPFSVQREEKGSWVPTLGLVKGGWFDWAGFLEPGGIGRCNALDLPADVAPGRYRIVKEVNRPKGPRTAALVTLTAPFTVVSSHE